MTNEILSIRPLVAILLPWISLLVIPILPRDNPRSHQNLKRVIYVLGSFASFAVVLSLLPSILEGKVLGIKLLLIVEQIEIHLTVDTLGYYYGLVLSFIWLLATIYSLGYIDHKENRYYGFMALCNSLTLGCAFSGNMFTYFIFLELLTLGVYPLIIHEETDVARRAGTKYLKYTIPAGAVILFATLLHYFWEGGNLSIVSSGTLSSETTPRSILMMIFFCYLAGFGVKAAIVPLEGWVPDAHPAAPSPVSALLSGIILKAGAFGIIRVVLNVFGLTLFKNLNLWIYLTAIASVTILVSGIFALTQDNLKRRLAYSSVGQVSYILLGLSLVSYYGVLGGVMHLAHHAIIKACLFFCAGIMITKTKKNNISEMAGVGYHLPVTMACFTVCTLAMIGTPLTVGFVSKWLLGSGAIEADKPYLLIILIISTLLNAAYYLPIVYTAFFKHPDSLEYSGIKFKNEVNSAMLWPTIMLAALVIFAGIWVTIPGFPYSLVSKVVMSYFIR